MNQGSRKLWKQWVRYIAVSPLAATLSIAAKRRQKSGRGNTWHAIQALKRVRDVFDLERMAARNVDPATWAYVCAYAESGKTMRRNRDIFDHFRIRARRLVDCSEINTSITLFDQQLGSPICLAPVALLGNIHPKGELAEVNGATTYGSLTIQSMLASCPIERVAAASHIKPWFQLFPLRDRAAMKQFLNKARTAGCGAIVLTVDHPVLGNRNGPYYEIYESSNRREPGNEYGNFRDIEWRERSVSGAGFTWEYVDWLRQNTDLKLVIKGIVTQEDATLALERGADALIVSNHGGRQEDSLRSTMESLPEVLAAVGKRIPVLIDSGFRRGTDVFKAIAIGARAVCIGRPYVWGLGAQGEQGIRRVLGLLQAELITIMKLAGTPSIGEIGSDSVVSPAEIVDKI